MKRKILVVDIGGTHVKLLMSPRDEREFPSGQRMGPKQFVARFKENVRGWKFDRASIGFPVPVRNGRITRNPKHLGKGWIGFNFSRALGTPVRVVNDAAMQALGSYRGGGRMLFLGLGIVGPKKMATRSYLRSHAIKKVVHRGLCCPRRRSCAPVSSITKGNCAW